MLMAGWDNPRLLAASVTDPVWITAWMACNCFRLRDIKEFYNVIS
jgi:hypothetical protein